MKYFIVADVHSYFDELQTALRSKGFDAENPNHTFVSLGDLFDRGPKPVECLKFVNGLPRKILIRGNHEDLLDSALSYKAPSEVDYSNGTVDTIWKLGKGKTYIDSCINTYESKAYTVYRNELIPFYETKTGIFVHGWIPCNYSRYQKRYCYDPNWRKASREDWHYARWYNGMAAWRDGVREEGKTIYCGHWHASWGHCYIDLTSKEFPNPKSTNPEHRVADFSPFIKDGIVALDACTVVSGKVNCYILEEE